MKGILPSIRSLCAHRDLTTPTGTSLALLSIVFSISVPIAGESPVHSPGDGFPMTTSCRPRGDLKPSRLFWTVGRLVPVTECFRQRGLLVLCSWCWIHQSVCFGFGQQTLAQRLIYRSFLSYACVGVGRSVAMGDFLSR